MTDLAQAVPALLDWYAAGARILPWRELPTPYRVWVSEIMLQQTRVEAVLPYFRRFMEALPTVEALAAVEEDRLLKLWEGLGYYSRARNLQKAAKCIVEQHGGKLPDTVEALLKLPGIGPYTAGAVASIAYGRRAAAVDGNVLRVMTRLTADFRDIGDPKTKRDIAALVEELMPEESAGMFTQALMELGAMVCIPNGAPKCEVCPMEGVCLARQRDIALSLPVKSPKKPRRIENRRVYVFVHEGKVALEQRKEKGLLSGLWQLPNVLEGEKEATDWGMRPLDVVELQPSKHIFTHIEWRMTNYLVAVEAPCPDFLWLTPTKITAQYALPSAFKKAWTEAVKRIEG